MMNVRMINDVLDDSDNFFSNSFDYSDSDIWVAGDPNNSTIKDITWVAGGHVAVN